MGGVREMIDSGEMTGRGLPRGFLPLLQLWLLRVLVKFEGYRHVMDDRRVLEAWAFRFVGVDPEEEGVPFNGKELLGRLKRGLAILAILAPKAPRNATLSKNIGWLTSSLGLTEVERDIVLFLAAAHHCTPLARLLDKLGALRTHEVHALMAVVLDRPYSEVSAALMHDSKLVSSGLVWVQLAAKWNLDAKIGLLQGVGEQLTLEHRDRASLFLSNFKRAVPTTLALHDFEHLGVDLRILMAYLKDSLANGRRGVNVLMHGPPGTGKSELTKVLASSLGAELFEIASEDRFANVHKPEARFGAFRLAQGVLGGNTTALILFDEVEDVFQNKDDEEGGSHTGNKCGRKAWINRLLEANPVPAVWVTNTTVMLDRAFIRRFDLVLEVGVPPRSVRSRLLDRYTSDIPVTTGWRARAAQHEGLTPATIEQAAKVTRVVLGALPDLDGDAVVDRVLGNALEALGASRRPRHAPSSQTTYRLDLLNADRDLVALRDGLRRTKAGRLCLYGPPGTGKTALAQHLAEVLDLPLHVHRASDILSAYLGETEAMMARMFRRAEEEGAVLLLDEADTFLRDRALAQRSWEVSQTNEMLTQMEAYEGIFVASTNLMGELDPASLRRFDIKIRFDYLNKGQRLSMFQDCLSALGLPIDNHGADMVGGMSRLTPGDYANVMRQARLDGPPTARHLADLLVRECSLKMGSPRRPIGFHGGC